MIVLHLQLHRSPNSCVSLDFSGLAADTPFSPTYNKKLTSLHTQIHTVMAGNDWVNSYLEAIIDSEPGLEEARGGSLLLRERGRFSPTRYFVENVIGFDETDLHRAWLRVCVLLICVFFNDAIVNGFYLLVL